MTTKNERGAILNIAPTYIYRPEFEVLQIYDRSNSEQILGSWYR